MDPLPLKTRPPIKPVVAAAIQSVEDAPTTDGETEREIVKAENADIEQSTDPAAELALSENNINDFDIDSQSSSTLVKKPELKDDGQQTSLRQRSASFLRNIITQRNSFKRSKSEEPPSKSDLPVATDSNASQDTSTTTVLLEKEKPQTTIKQRSATFLKNILPKKHDNACADSSEITDSISHGNKDADSRSEDTSTNKKSTVKQRSAAFIKNLLPKKGDTTTEDQSIEPSNDFEQTQNGSSDIQNKTIINQETDENRRESDDKDDHQKEDKVKQSKQSSSFLKNIIDSSKIFGKSEEINYFVRDRPSTPQSTDDIVEDNAKKPHNNVEDLEEATDLDNDEEQSVKEGEKSNLNLKQKSSALVKNILKKSSFSKKSKLSSDVDSTDLSENINETSPGVVNEERDPGLENLKPDNSEIGTATVNKNQSVKQRGASFVKNILERSPISKKPSTQTEDKIDNEGLQQTDEQEVANGNSLESDKPPNVKLRSSAFLKHILERNHAKTIQAEEPAQTGETNDNSDETDQEATPPVLSNQTRNPKCCHPIVEKLKTMADKQYHKGKTTIRKFTIKSDETIDLDEQQSILNLKESPRAERNKGFASYVVKHQDSDDVLEIVELDESPSEVRRRREQDHADRLASVLIPDEIIELPTTSQTQQEENSDAVSIEPTINELLEEEYKNNPPKKSPRKSKEHVYEDIDDGDAADPLVVDFAAQLRREDESFARQMLETSSNVLRPLDSVESAESETTVALDEPSAKATLAPISSIDSNSSDDDRIRNRLSALSEDPGSVDITLEMVDNIDPESSNRKSNIKRDNSPGLEKKVTFSSSTEAVESEAEHDGEEGHSEGRWSKMR